MEVDLAPGTYYIFVDGYGQIDSGPSSLFLTVTAR
jgi:hypothetical protein